MAKVVVVMMMYDLVAAITEATLRLRERRQATARAFLATRAAVDRLAALAHLA